MKQEFHFFRMLRRIAPMVYKFIPVSFIFFSFFGALSGVSLALLLFTNQVLFDALSDAVFSHGQVSTV